MERPKRGRTQNINILLDLASPSYDSDNPMMGSGDLSDSALQAGRPQSRGVEGVHKIIAG